MRATSRDYQAPHRPWPVRALNAVWSYLPQAALDADAWIDAAVAAEGLTDFGPAPLHAPFEILCESLRDEAQLTPLGRTIVRTRFVNALRARLRSQHCFSADPTILERPITPIVITGLQRTGTTFLHRLLAADPQLRALRSFEALHPAPPRGTDRRLARAEQAARAVRYLAPDFQAVHPIVPSAPEEEVVVLEQTGLTTSAEATLRVPRFSRWLEAQDQRPAYAWLKTQLQLLAPGLWVLKTPHHLEWLDVLIETFPNVQVIFTHRDPTTTLASFCSMVAHGWGLCTDQVDPSEIGAHWLRKNGRLIDRALYVRDATPTLPVHDVSYRALIADPVETVRGIYAFLGRSFTDAHARAIRDACSRTVQHQHGRHRYALADFGLTTERVAERFATYRTRFAAEIREDPR